jgi:hypothetical protein
MFVTIDGSTNVGATTKFEEAITVETIGSEERLHIQST